MVGKIPSKLKGRFMLLKKIRSGGFVLVEFAIALPLLIIILYSLAMVSLNIFRLGRDQLADYVLEAEAQYAMERITQAARYAKDVQTFGDTIKVKFVYHSLRNTDYNASISNPYHFLYISRDIWETRYFFGQERADRGDNLNLYAERQGEIYTNPITGDNYFGDTKLNYLRCALDEPKKILHIELEMESLVTERKIKIATAVFMPGLEVE